MTPRIPTALASALAALLFFPVFSCAAHATSDTTDAIQTTKPAYEPGHGLPLADSGFTLGGYGSAQYQDLKNADERVSLNHLSVLLWWEGDSPLKFFSELDSENTLSTDTQSDAGDKRHLALERFYFDYTLSDALTVRAGKFLTPIGRWNLLHADPLVWTTSRPLITSNLFPDNATGVMALGNFPLLQRQADYSVYASTGNELRADPAQDPFNEAYGARLNVPVSDNLQYGISYASFAQQAKREEQKKLVGLDFLWSSHGYELTGEAAYRNSDEGSQRVAKGAFVQAVMPVHDKLFAVGRLEAMRQSDAAHTAHMWVVGLNYRYTPALSFKLELVHAADNDVNAPEGLLSSVNVLF